MRRGLQGCLPGGCRGVSPPPDPTSLATALSARAGAISKPDGAATARDGTPASAAGGGGGTRNSGGADRTERTGTEKVGSLPSLVSRTASAISLPTSRRPPARTHTSSIGEWSNAGWKQVPLSAPPLRVPRRDRLGAHAPPPREAGQLARADVARDQAAEERWSLARLDDGARGVGQGARADSQLALGDDLDGAHDARHQVRVPPLAPRAPRRAPTHARPLSSCPES